MAEPGRLERLGEVMADVNAPAEIFGRLTDEERPMTLPEVAKEWGLPRGKFVAWVLDKHRGMYDSALKVLTDGMVFQSLRVADEVAEDKDAIAKAKLRIDTMLRTAARWDRERYGERDTAALVVNVNLADTAKEIAELERRLGLRAPVVLPVVVDADVVAEPI